MLEGKCIVLGVCGGIAAYKAAEMVRLLQKQGADVHVIMTQSATHFIGPLTLQTLSRHPVHVDQFELIEKSEIGHISLADRADLMVICPATANVMGKVASGIADDLLTTTIMTTRAPVLFAPAMNTNMWDSPGMRATLGKIDRFGYSIVEPGSGDLACGDEGKGRLADVEDILYEIIFQLTLKPLHRKKIVVTAGPTWEPLDPVRFISNRSSGKMGFALARAASLYGANVTLIAGPTLVSAFSKVDRMVHVETAEQMLEATKEAFDDADALFMCAAVADFRPKDCRERKTPKSEVDQDCALVENPDILKTMAQSKGDRLVVGFAAETHDLLEKAQRKMASKGVDFIIANDVSRSDIAFNAQDNEVRIIGADNSILELPKQSKTKLAFAILDHIFQVRSQRLHL